MLGIIGYEPNYSDTICDCGVVETPQSTTGLMTPYPPVTMGYNVAGANPNSINAWGQTWMNIHWTPLINTASTEMLLSGYDLIDCATIELSSTTQDVPFYMWSMSNNNFGNHHNDWEFTKGMYREPLKNMWGVDITGLLGLWPTDLHADPNGPSIVSGWYQDDMYPTLDRPPLVNGSGVKVNFSQPLYYYFGVRPGKTAYNIFIRKYVDEALADTVI